MSTSAPDFSARYRVENVPGVAFWLKGYYTEPDEDAEWTGIAVEDESRVRAVMVGDDREHIVDVDDLVMIGEDDYCSCCGQIGCGWS